MSIDNLFADFQDEMGWNDRSKLLLCGSFIEEQGLLESFAAFLTKQAQEEREESIGGPVVELTRLDGMDREVANKNLNDAWTQGTLYRGDNVYEMLYGSDEIWSVTWPGLPDENQESYMGYDGAQDRFIIGFDVWVSDDEEYSDDGDNNLFSFKVEGGKIVESSIEALEFSGRTPYGLCQER